MSTNQVVVSEDRKPVHIFDGDLNEVEVGTMVSRIYEGERVQRHSFFPVTSKGNLQPEYSLGPTSTSFSFVDHTAALAPLLEQGYTITKQMLGKGGLQLNCILEPEKSDPISDPIEWDRNLWIYEGDKVLREMLNLSTTIRPGHGIYYRRGFFRTICANGLVAEALSLGSARFTHTNWSAPGVVKKFPPFYQPHRSSGEVLGPFIGTKKGVHKFSTLVKKVIESPEEKIGQEEVPFYIRDSINTLGRMPTWWLNLYNLQLETFLDRGPENFYALDSVNALTSPVSIAEATDTSTALLRPLERINTLFQTTSQFIGTLSMG